jgi:hypothetical protein
LQQSRFRSSDLVSQECRLIVRIQIALALCCDLALALVPHTLFFVLPLLVF